MKHGLLLINKPSGITSHDVVARVRKALGTREVGHAGTLDPLASGLLVLLIGEGTKISDYVLTGDKGYRVGVRFGIATDTYDIDGRIVQEEAVALDPEKIAAAARALTGEFEWAVPVYSAVKKGGQELYKMARRGEQVTAPMKKMAFRDVKALEVTSNTLEAEIYCSKGSYIRSWAVELGKTLGVPAVVAKLHRIYSAPFRVEAAVDLEQFEAAAANGEIKGFVSMNEALPHFLTLTVRGRDERLMQSGQISFDLERRLIYEQKEANRSNRGVGIKVLSGGSGQMLSILEVQPFQKIKVKRVFKGLDVAL